MTGKRQNANKVAVKMLNLLFLYFAQGISDNLQNFYFRKTPLLIHHNLIGSKENWKTACMVSEYLDN